MEFLLIFVSIANLTTIIVITVIDKQMRKLDRERLIIVFRLMVLNRMMKTESDEILHAYKSLLEELKKLK